VRERGREGEGEPERMRNRENTYTYMHKYLPQICYVKIMNSDTDDRNHFTKQTGLV
jgi:hypothetical protein